MNAILYDLIGGDVRITSEQCCGNVFGLDKHYLNWGEVTVFMRMMCPKGVAERYSAIIAPLGIP